MSDPIFVFGSNTAARHGTGAALFAAQWRGAKAAEGRTGEAYAIPTKDAQLKTRSLEDIKASVDRFIEYAEKHPDLRFQITRIGCGLAGLGDDEIAPLFARAPINCFLPGLWEQRRYPHLKRVIIAGTRTFKDAGRLRQVLDPALERWGKLNLMVVSGGAKGADALGEAWARGHGITVMRFPANWDRYGNAAGPIRNALMAWWSTALVAFLVAREASRGTRNMIKTAQQGGLKVHVVEV